MKLMKHLLFAFCVLALLVSVIGVASVAANTVVGAEALIAAYDDAEDKDAAIASLRKYLEGVSTSADGYDELMESVTALETRYVEEVLFPVVQEYSAAGDKATAVENSLNALAKASELATNYDALYNEATGQQFSYVKTVLIPAAKASTSGTYAGLLANAKYRILEGFLNHYPLNEEDSRYATVASDIETLKAAYEDRINTARDALYAKASLSDYVDYPTEQYSVDLQNEPVGSALPATLFNHTDGKISMPNKGGNNVYGVKEDALGNRYYCLTYHAPANHNYADINWTNVAGAVFEFDFSTDSKVPTSVGFASPENGNNGRMFPNWFYLNNGTFTSGGPDKDTGSTITIPNLISRGAWTHFTIVLDPTTGYCTVYIDYVKVGSWNKSGSAPYIEKYTASHLRFGSLSFAEGSESASLNEGASICIDNIIAYNGTTVRQLDALTMIESDADRALIYYASLLNNDNISFNDRYLAISRATAFLPSYYDLSTETYTDKFNALPNGELKSAIITITGVDTSALIAEAQSRNLASLKEQVAALQTVSNATNRTFDNIATRKASAEKIEAYIKANVFDTNNDEYISTYADLVRLSTYVGIDTAAKAFCVEMETFDKKFTLFSMQRHYEKAVEYYAELDPSYVYPGDYGTRFANALSVYAGAYSLIAEYTRAANTEKLLALVKRLNAYPSNVWDEKYDEINPYVVNTRNLINEGNYNADAAGVSDSIAAFATINEYFYNKLQELHAAAIEEKLNDFRNATTYIERFGALSMVERYLAQNDVDMTNANIVKVLASYSVMQEQLENQHLEYDAVLNQNTTRFINVVNIMKAYTDYSTLKKYYDRATEYYYAMNISGEGIEDRIAEYNAIGAKLEKIAADSDALVRNVKRFEALNLKTEMYAALTAALQALDNHNNPENVIRAYLDKAEDYIALAEEIGYGEERLAALNDSVALFFDEEENLVTKEFALYNAIAFGYRVLGATDADLVSISEDFAYWDRAMTKYAQQESEEIALTFLTGVGYDFTIEKSVERIEAAEKLIAMQTKNEVYRTLVACYRAQAGADPTFAGVASALEVYNQRLAAYNAEILPRNGEIAVATDAMCAVRSLCSLKSIMSVIRTILY